jgi:hypothetical protein
VMTRKEENELYDRVSTAFDAHSTKTLAVELGPVHWMALLGTLQLALRHPMNKNASLLMARGVALSIETWLKQLDPALGELAALGWDPNADHFDG